jgi:hypothetical protein
LPGELASVMTIAAPHAGADLATAAAALAGEPLGVRGLRALRARLDLPFALDARSVVQISELSPLIERLQAASRPPGVRLLSIGGRGDAVVPATHTSFWDAPNPIVDLVGPDVHTRIPGADATTRELGLALSGLPPTCEELAGVVADTAVAEGLSWSQDLLGFALWQRVAGG